MRGIKIPQQDFALKMPGGLMREGGGGAYLRDTTVLLRYTKINGNFCLPAERPHCKIILPVRNLRAVFKSETISL